VYCSHQGSGTNAETMFNAGKCNFRLHPFGNQPVKKRRSGHVFKQFGIGFTTSQGRRRLAKTTSTTSPVVPPITWPAGNRTVSMKINHRCHQLRMATTYNGSLLLHNVNVNDMETRSNLNHAEKHEPERRRWRSSMSRRRRQILIYIAMWPPVGRALTGIYLQLQTLLLLLASSSRFYYIIHIYLPTMMFGPTYGTNNII